MITATPSPLPVNGAPGAAASSSATAATPFDAILTLEALAATCAALDSSPLGGGALEGAGLEGLGDADTDDDDGSDESGSPLAFLVNLLNMAAPTPDVSASGDSTTDDALAGKAAADAAVALLQPGADADADAAAGKLLLAAVADSGNSDTAGTQDPAALARAAEMLAHGPRHAAGTDPDRITTPVHSPRWADDLGARVAMMVRGAESSASLQLTPVDLGPLEIKVTVRDSQTSIQFGAANAETRALLEASIPKLREMLAAQGFNLMDASVSQGFTRQHRSDTPPVARIDGSPSDPDPHEITRVTALGLLDTYA
jgi:flagellar hook-length control protein FliK